MGISMLILVLGIGVFTPLNKTHRLSLLKEVEAVGVGRTDTGFKGDGEPVPTSLPFIRRAGGSTGVPLS